MSLAMLCRCDAGGLATITAEMHRHLCPQRALLLDLGDRGRGPCNDLLYGDLADHQQLLPAFFDGQVPDRIAEWIGSPGVSTLFSAETFYSEKIMRAARDAEVRTVMLAMPELAPWATTSPDRAKTLKPDVVLVPTAWRLDTLPGAEVLPVPVARDRLVPTRRTRATHLYHVTGAAMLDRNGTELVLKALPLMKEPCRFTIRSTRSLRIPPTCVDVEVIADQTSNYWEAYPPDTDLLVMPRRYGGLCLPVAECASLGVPAVMLGSDPYSNEPFVFSVPASSSRDHPMKGAWPPASNGIPVWDASPSSLAGMLDWLVANPELIVGASVEANVWAEEHAWDGPLGQRWCAMLDAGCATIAV